MNCSAKELKRIFDLEDEFLVVAEGRTGREAIRIAVDEKREILILDINMPDMNGIEATKQLAVLARTRVCSSCRFMMMSPISHMPRSRRIRVCPKRSRVDRAHFGRSCGRKGWAYLHPKVTTNVIKDYRRILQFKGASRPQRRKSHRRPGLSTLITS